MRSGAVPLFDVLPTLGMRGNMKFTAPDSRWPRRFIEAANAPARAAQPAPPAREGVPPAVTPAELEQALDEKFGWLISSFDLKHGLQVSEVEFDTIPGELLDGFKKKR
jgi:hypothetical protein